MTCKELKRLTVPDVHKAKTNTEQLMNFAYAKDNRVFIPQPYKDDIDLCEYVSKLTKVKGCTFPPEEIMEGACLECDRDCEIGILYYCAVQAAELRERLKMFEDKLEKGTLIELPCKVGDKAYVIKNNKIHTKDIVYYNKIHSRIAEQNEEYWHCVDKDRISINAITFYPEDIGKTVFLTKSEAEQKLKELQND